MALWQVELSSMLSKSTPLRRVMTKAIRRFMPLVLHGLRDFARNFMELEKALFRAAQVPFGLKKVEKRLQIGPQAVLMEKGAHAHGHGQGLELLAVGGGHDIDVDKGQARVAAQGLKKVQAVHARKHL